MREAIINYSKIKLLNDLRFLDELGYKIEMEGINEDGKFEIKFSSASTKKEISFVISDSEQVNRFYITISIVRKPYLEVNDYVDFDEYLKKNDIVPPRTLEGQLINDNSIEHYISEYSRLFESHGIELIATDKQFKGYFPKWT